jgi:hypothetical protein
VTNIKQARVDDTQGQERYWLYGVVTSMNCRFSRIGSSSNGSGGGIFELLRKWPIINLVISKVITDLFGDY